MAVPCTANSLRWSRAPGFTCKPSFKEQPGESHALPGSACSLPGKQQPSPGDSHGELSSPPSPLGFVALPNMFFLASFFVVKLNIPLHCPLQSSSPEAAAGDAAVIGKTAVCVFR